MLDVLRRSIVLPLWAVALIALAIVVLIVIIWSLKRRRDPKFEFSSGDSLHDLLPSIVGTTHASLIEGNTIEVLENGRFFDALFDALTSARRSITFETFLWRPGNVSQRLVDLLRARREGGVEVRILLDGSGGEISREERRQLERAGCVVARYHPFRVSNLGTVNNRDHRKIAVIDGSIGFIGGHCIADEWLGDGEDREHYRDISVRVEGPVVAELQAAFQENWLEETGEVLVGDVFFPELEPRGDIRAHLVYVSPSGMSSSIEVLHYVAIGVAKEQVLIQNPYFVPDPEMIDALIGAVRRGVDVRVMLPAVDVTDSAIVQHASHHRFGKLLEGGVKIFEHTATLIHQKVMVLDHAWVSVGSANFDDRSFEVNKEVTLGVADRRLAARFEEIFERDLKRCREIRLDEWKHRRALHKLTDFGAFIINEQL